MRARKRPGPWDPSPSEGRLLPLNPGLDRDAPAARELAAVKATDVINDPELPCAVRIYAIEARERGLCARGGRRGGEEVAASHVGRLEAAANERPIVGQQAIGSLVVELEGDVVGIIGRTAPTSDITVRVLPFLESSTSTSSGKVWEKFLSVRFTSRTMP